MSGTDKSLCAELRIAKSPDEVLSLIAKHALTIEMEPAPKKKQGSLLSLTDLLINNVTYITEDSISPIVKAMADKDEDVAVTADVCVITVAADSPKTVFSTLVKEAKGAKGTAKKRMVSTVSSLYALASEKEKANLLQLAWLHKFKPLIKRESILNSTKAKSKKGNTISLDHLKPNQSVKQIRKLRRVA